MIGLPLKTHRSAGVSVTGKVRQLIREADACRDAKKWSAAAGFYRQALDSDPTLAHIWVQHGHALKEAGDLPAAEAAYRHAIGLAPGDGDAHLHLGHALKLQGRTSKAIDAYIAALDAAPGLADALDELMTMAEAGVPVRSALFRTLSAGLAQPSSPVPGQAAAADREDPSARAETAILALIAELRREGGHEDVVTRLSDAQAALGTLDRGEARETRLRVFDVSDLISYFRHSRPPSGIQRVQIRTILAGLEMGSAKVCTFFADGWLEIPSTFFQELAAVSLAGSDNRAAIWLSLLRRLTLLLSTSEPFVFPQGAWLIALGTSWHPEYLLQIRALKQAFSVRYIPFVHDLIPIKTPEHCLPELTRDFVAWLVGVFVEADAFFTNSESTRRDLLEAAERLGYGPDPNRVRVVRLDADFRKAEQGSAPLSVLRDLGLAETPYVLFVSTIEPRKNHLAAFAAWERLVRDCGAERTPKLVCVGGRGWLNEAIFARLDSSVLLKRHVQIVSGVSDSDLSSLYQHCLFTLYPSHYEGWGLPITEALCHGKLPLITDNASLAEAGGGLAEVFEEGSDRDLDAALRRLIFDAAYRTDRERRISQAFRPRSWTDIATDIDHAIEEWTLEDGDRTQGETTPMTVAFGRYYPVARNRITELLPDLGFGGPLRRDPDWHRLEDWGCWSRTSTFALAANVAPSPSGRLTVYLGVQALPGTDSAFACSFGDHSTVEGTLVAGRTRWLAATIAWPDQGQSQRLEVIMRGDHVFDLSATSAGADGRHVGPGAIGLYVCDAQDVAARTDILEAISLESLDELSRRSISAPHRAVEAPVAQTPLEPQLDAADQIDLKGVAPDTTAGDIIVLQSCDPVRYFDMLMQSARTTRVFCQRQHLTYQSFIGLKRGELDWHASYNRIDLLAELVASGFRGWVFYLDADTWIEDLDFDLRSYLADKSQWSMIAAPAGHVSDLFWNINNGIILFNLGHPLTRALIERWQANLSRYELSKDVTDWNVGVPDDQGMLHQILDKQKPETAAILHVDKMFLNSPWATFARQLIRAENPDFDTRLETMRRAVDAVLQRHGLES